MKLDYLIKKPKNAFEKAPLLLLLHGYGSNKEDLFSFADELPDTCFVVAAQAPHSLGYGSAAWYAINFDADENKFSDIEQAKQSRDLILNFIDLLAQEYPIDKNDITLVGFSQGAILSFAIGLSYPKKIRRIVAMSGYLNTDMLTTDVNANDFSNFSVFQSHGTVDQVVPADWARKAKPFLDNLNIQSVYNEYQIGHGISPQNFYDFKNWLTLSQKI